MKHSFVANDRVWYWTRRTGERANRRFGTIRHVDEHHARIRVDDPHIPTQTIEVKRLNHETEDDIRQALT